MPAHCKQHVLKTEDDRGNTVLYTRHHMHEQDALNGFCMDLPSMAWLVDAMLDERKEMLVDTIQNMHAKTSDHDLIFSFCRVPDQVTSWPTLLDATQAWCTRRGMEFKVDEEKGIYADLRIDQLQPMLHLLQRLLNSKRAVLSLPSWELGELQAAAEYSQVTAPDSICDLVTNFDAVIRNHLIQINPLFRATLRPYRETEQFLPHFKVVCLSAGQQAVIEDLNACQLVVCPFSMVHRLRWALESIQWAWLVVDESQRIKNANTQIAKSIKQIKANRRLALSGTPIENHLGELWSQLDFLMPGLLGSRKEFDNHWRKPIEKELPPKTEQIIRVPLGSKQAQIYETVRATMDKRLRDILNKNGFAKSQILFLEALLRLRQICCDPALVNDKAPSAKLELLLDLLQTLVEEKRTVLVFSQFAEMLHRIEAELFGLDIPCLKLTGQTKNREELIEQFRAGAAPVFLISLKAGGVGLNLTETDTVIMFDPWWNPAAEQQAVDREHRIGQTRQVNVIRLIAKNTVEEKILKLQERKNDIAKQVLAGKQLDTILNEEDFLEMFATGTNQSQDL